MSNFLRLSSILAVLAALLGGAITYRPVRAAGVLYAKPGPTGIGDCSSWVNACMLQNAIAAAASSDQIWVQAGTYTPHASDRAVSFNLKSGVAIYGGFAGTETQLSQRNPTANITILSGDLSGDDIGFTNNSENSHHVVIGTNTNSAATLDGFIIRGGNGDSFMGGGMYNFSGNPTLRNVTFSGNSAYSAGGMGNDLNSNPTLLNVTFSGNSATYGGGMGNDLNSNPTLLNVTFSENFATNGGGMRNYNSSPTLTNVTFSANSAASDGGGMNNYNSNPPLTNVTFSANSASYGGGMFNGGSSPMLTNVTFSGNSAVSGGARGGGMYNTASNPTLTKVTFSGNSASDGAGGMLNSTSNPTLTNVTFSGNFTSGYGGGMSNFSSNPILTNVTFSGNSASDGGGMYNIYSSSPELINTILANSQSGGDCVNALSTLSASSSNNLIEDASNACGLTNSVDGNILGADPKLASLSNNGGFTQTLALLRGSPAIDKGTNANCPATDQRGVARPWGSLCDIGASEFRTFMISGNAGTAGVTLSYTDEIPKSVISPLAGNYSLTVPNSWIGTVTPSHPCFTFNPLSRNYNNLIANIAAQDYSTTFNPASGCARVDVKFGQAPKGTFGIPQNAGARLSFPVDSGPVFVNGTNGVPFIASERVIYPKGSSTFTNFSEMMGLPANLSSTRYSFPAYDNVAFDSQLRFANIGNANTTVTVVVGGVLKGSYPLIPNQSMRTSYAGLSGGPVIVQSTGNVPVITSLRVLTRPFNGSFSEIMGLPQSQVGARYVFPWYNNVSLDTQLRVGNVGAGVTTVTVTVGGATVGTFSLALNESKRISFPNVNGGPVRVTSVGNIVASLRVLPRNSVASFSELMGLPESQLGTAYVFPWYNNLGLDTQLRFANMSGSTATVRVYIGGQEVTGSPFTLAAGTSTRKSFAANKGPVVIRSTNGVKIIASLRVLFQDGSTPIAFSELMGLPESQLATGYYFPWYNNLALDTQLRLGVP